MGSNIARHSKVSIEQLLTSLPLVRMSSAPKAFSRMRRSVDMVSGMVRMSL